MEPALLFARNNLLSYAIAQYSSYRPADHHRKIANALERVVKGQCKRLMIFMPPRHGKQIDDDTPVLTTFGWKRHGDLNTSDMVFGIDGKPLRIIAVSKPYPQDCEVEFTDGSLVRCHENHEWTIYDRGLREFKTVETKYLENRRLWSGPKGKRTGRAVIQLPKRKAIDMPDAMLTLHPYVLGAWLGDGKSADSSICWAEKDEIVAQTVNGYSAFSSQWQHKITKVNYGYISGARSVLRKLGVLNNKHIPQQYLLSSKKQRLELLAGLIDTDGHVEKETQRVRIATVSDQLASGIEDLIRSLGWRANRYTQEPAVSSSGIIGKQSVHYISFTPDRDIPTRIERKAIIGNKNKQRVLGFAAVRRVEKSIGRCIQVDSEDGLYLVGREMIPTHNSQLASEFFPAWFLGHHPDRYIIATTYAQELADDFGRKVRNQLQDPLYKAIFPECQISSDSASASKFNTDQKGSYFAVGAGGPITGRGAHCLIAGTKVMTSLGEIPIEDLHTCATSCKILSYNIDKKEFEYGSLQACKSRKGDGIYRITTRKGRVVESTADHPFYVEGKGYVWASTLTPGDSLLCQLSEKLYQNSFRVPEASEKRTYGHVLFSGMLGSASLYQESKEMHCLRKSSAEKDSEILRKLPRQEKEGSTEVSIFRKALSYLQYDVLGNVAWKIGRKVRGILFKTLRGNWPLKTDVWHWQSKMERWGHSFATAAAFSQGIPSNAPACAGTGRTQMHFVSGYGKEASCASYRQQSYEQFSNQSGVTLLQMPQTSSFGYRFQEEHDEVAMVERVRESDTVYDIQVSGNHNFFANGVLVHNCLLIDDPIKGREDAESDTSRRKLKEWYQSVARTRLMPNGAIVVIQTRWHEADLSGWLLDAHSHENWEVISLPAISEEGTALWPDMYDLPALESIRDSIGSRDWNALYQQNPIPDSGDFFKREWFRFYDVPPTDMYVYGSSDFGVRPDDGDPTEHGIFGVDSNKNIYVLDWWSGQTDSAEWINAMLDLHDQWKTMRWFGESGVIRRAVEPYLVKRMEERNVYPSMEWLPSIASKDARAKMGFVGLASNGKIFLPRKTQWAADLLSQLIRYIPNVTKRDDKVDVCSLIGRGLQYVSAPSGSNVRKIDAYRTKKSRSTSAWIA